MSDDPLKNPIKPPRMDPDEALSEIVDYMKKLGSTPPPEPYKPEKYIGLSLNLTLVEAIAVFQKLKEIRGE